MTLPQRWFLTGVAALVVATAQPASSQVLDPDRCVTCRDKIEHFAAGAGLDLVVRGPWVARPFRDRAWKRLGLILTMATAWEAIQTGEARQQGRSGQQGYGFSPLDVAATTAGAMAMELLVDHIQGRLRR